MIYVLTLLNDEKRRLNLKSRFPNRYKDFSFKFAFDSNFIKNNTENILKNNTDRLTIAEIACALSHKKILIDFLGSELDYCLILEDDIHGSDCLIDLIFFEYQKLPAGSVLIAGGQEGLRSYKNLYGIRVEGEGQLYKIPKLYYRYLSRACCYILSREIAKKIVTLQERKLNTADQWDVLLKNCDHVYFSPILKHPISLGDSHIEAERKIKKGNNIFIAIYREGVFHSLYFFLRKKATSLWARVRKYQNIKKENI